MLPENTPYLTTGNPYIDSILGHLLPNRLLPPRSPGLISSPSIWNRCGNTMDVWIFSPSDCPGGPPLGPDDPVSPLILDLDGDGVEADALAYFDHEGDGWNELSRWANEDDGVLVWDRNADGIINDGSELFGNNTVISDGTTASNGFAALSDLDDNDDGVINAQDTGWSKLRVMR